MHLRFTRFFIFTACSLIWAAAASLTAESPAVLTPAVTARGAGAVHPALAGLLAAQAQAPAPAPASPPPAQAGDFAGDDTCTACHENALPQLTASLHGKAVNPRTPAAKTNQMCETCHGPGREHAETGDKTKIRVFTDISPRDASAVCLTCHTKSSHALWKGSTHDVRNLTCTTCHSVHTPVANTAQLKTASVTETCAVCHRQQTAKLQRFGHMPVREGKMECTSCHDPHGSTNVRLLRTGNWISESCVSCHTEKRGPYLWDHAPVREACSTCHDPHGSNQERMLVAKLPMLCQRCHIGTKHPSTIYDGTQLEKRSSRLIDRGCVNCHSQIHGSNSPAGHAFMR